MLFSIKKCLNSAIKPCLLLYVRGGSRPSTRVYQYKDGHQGCQLPGFSLRSQAIFYTADFLIILSKTTTVSHSLTKQPASTLESQFFYSIFQINSCEARQKQKERPFSAGTFSAGAGLWLVVTRTLSTSRSFQTFLRHYVCNPKAGGSYAKKIKHYKLLPTNLKTLK